MKRLFVAIGLESLSFDPKMAFKKVKVNLSRKEIEHRWVPPENYHITLSFLGEVRDELVSSLEEKLRELTQHFSSFELKVEGLGAFPDLEQGRVIWAGIQNSVSMRELQALCTNELRTLGFEFAERFTPHLTIARLRSTHRLKDVLSPLLKTSFGKIKVDRINLYESKLRGPFPIYEVLRSFPLSRI